MERIRKSPIGAGALQWQVLAETGSALSFDEVVRGWCESAAFRALWRAGIGDVPFDAWCWECPPVTAGISARPFECVFISSPALARVRPDPEAFAEHFRPDRSAVTFGNLGGDAVLVAPCPGAVGTDYSQLASFTATAPQAQQDALWHAVGEAMRKRIGASPAWLSTAGLGVAWLHVRLDDRPKYYRHAAYARG
jgi:hypothetical protein